MLFCVIIFFKSSSSSPWISIAAAAISTIRLLLSMAVEIIHPHLGIAVVVVTRALSSGVRLVCWAGGRGASLLITVIVDAVGDTV